MNSSNSSETPIYTTTYNLTLTEDVPINRYHDAIDFLKAQALEALEKDGITLASPVTMSAQVEITIYSNKSIQVDK